MSDDFDKPTEITREDIDKFNKKEGWTYKGKESLNLWRNLLKEMQPTKIEIIPDDPADQEIADQMSAYYD